jgi:MFS family permease
MWQISKFYLSSFLRNQTYFVPVFVILLQLEHGLSLQQIFWIFAIGNVMSFVMEIPSGIIADIHGKKKSLIFAKGVIFISFLLFGFSHSFWMFVLAQIVYELGNSFRSGTESAYVYDFLKEHRSVNHYVQVKARQKASARFGEALATAVGGFIATAVGLNHVFLIAAIPAFINLLLVLSYQRIEEQRPEPNTRILHEYALEPLRRIFTSKLLFFLTFNIAIFTAIIAASEKFIQPYMYGLDIPISLFGVIYAVALAFTAAVIGFFSPSKYQIQDETVINTLTLFAIVPLFVVSMIQNSIAGLILLFAMVILHNLRSPLITNLFHKHIDAATRSTSASILEQFKSLGKIAILPFAGYLTDAFSMYVAMGILAIIIAIMAIMLWLPLQEKYMSKSVL